MLAFAKIHQRDQDERSALGEWSTAMERKGLGEGGGGAGRGETGRGVEGVKG